MNDLPDFPKFTQLDLRHKQTLLKIAENFPPYSDFNFVSMFTWDVDGQIKVSNLAGNIVVKFSDYSDGQEFLSILGINELDESLVKIFNYCVEAGLPEELKLVGEGVIDAIPKKVLENYVIEEDRDNHDYILSAINMSDLAGFHPKKRTKYNRFIRDSSGKLVVCKEMDMDSPVTHQQIRDLIVEWQQLRNRLDEDSVREMAAIDRCLDHHKQLGIRCYGTFIDDKLTAFTIFEIVHNKTAMLHFGKSNTAVKGSSEHLQHNLAKYLRILDIEFMNNEQDLGIEGLRKSKEASLPVDFLKKYTISPAKKS